MTMKSRSMLKALVLVLLVTVFLAGCGNNANTTGNNGNTGSNGGNQPAPGETPKQEEKQPDPVTIEFWHAYGEGEEQVLLDEVLPKFNEAYPHITVQATRMPTENLEQQVLTAAAGGVVPDVMRMDNTWIPRMASEGVLAEVSGFPNFDALREASFPGPVSTNLFDGKYYGIALDTNTKIAIYNKELLELAGATAPPQTVDELVALARALKSKGDYFGITVGGVDLWNMPPWFWTLGGQITDPEFKTATGYLNSAASVQALETIVSWNDEGLLAPPILYEPPGTWEGLRGEEGAPASYMMINEGPWFFSILGDAVADTMIPAKMPNGPDGASHSIIGGQNMVIFEGAKQPDAAWTFTEFMLTDDIQTLMAVKTGAIPVIKSAANAEELKSIYYLGAYIEEMETAYARTPHPKMNEIGDVFQRAMESAVRKQAAPQEALDKAAAEIDALLQ